MSATANELLAVMGARELRDNTTVFTGVGAPMMASVLAQRSHTPGPAPPCAGRRPSISAAAPDPAGRC